MITQLADENDAKAAAEQLTGMTFDKTNVVLYLSNVFDERAIVGRYTQCAISVCGGMQYDTPSQPRTIGIKVSHDF